MNVNRYSLAGQASARARRLRLGEEGFHLAMQKLGGRGGRPGWRESLDKGLEKDKIRQGG